MNKAEEVVSLEAERYTVVMIMMAMSTMIKIKMMMTMTMTHLEAAEEDAALAAQGPLQVHHLLFVIVHDLDVKRPAVATAASCAATCV